MKVMSSAMVRTLFAIITMFLLLTSPAATNAGIVYDNGLPGGPGTPGALSDYDSRFPPASDGSYFTFSVLVGDDFILSEGTSVVTGILWWGFRRDDESTTDIDESEVHESPFTFQIFPFADGGPLPEPIYSIDTGIIVGSPVDPDKSLYEYYINLDPIILTAGEKYLLSIVCRTGTPEVYGDNWAWMLHSNEIGDFYYRRVFDFELETQSFTAWEIESPNTLAFQLYGPTTTEEQSEVLENFLDDSVNDGDVVGSGPGNSATGRLKALENMVADALDLIEQGDYEGACQKLQNVHNRTDGNPRPPDFVTGDAASELAALVENLMVSIGCFSE